HHAAILAVETVPYSFEQFQECLLVHHPSPPTPLSSARGERSHSSPPRSPPPAADGGGPIALRTRTNFILCDCAVIVCRTLHTKYFPECRLPTPSTCTTVPTRSTPCSRARSASPSQRRNQPASRNSDFARIVSSPASSTGAVSSTDIGLPAQAAGARASRSGRSVSVVSPPTPSSAGSVKRACRPVTLVGRITSHSKSSASTFQTSGSFGFSVNTASPLSAGFAK